MNVSYYCAIFTDKPIEEMDLEESTEHPRFWTYYLKGNSIGLEEEDESWKDPGEIRELRLTENLYFNKWGCGDMELCLADDYLKRTGGRIYITMLLFLDIEDEASTKISKTAPENIKILDLKDISEELRNNDGRPIFDPEPYVIYEIVNSGYKNE